MSTGIVFQKQGAGTIHSSARQGSPEVRRQPTEKQSRRLQFQVDPKNEP